MTTDINAGGKLHNYLVSQGIAVVTVRQSGTTLSVITVDPAQQAQANSIASTWPTSLRAPRTLPSIYTDLSALTAIQKTNVWTDLSSGSPAKYLTDNGSEPGAIATLDWAVRFSGLAAAAITDAKLRIAAIYCRDNPTYLVTPSFDPTINVPGDQLA